MSDPAIELSLPFSRYKNGGRVLLGPPSQGTGSSRTGYGLSVVTECGSSCVYCGQSLGEPYEAWLGLSIDHVIPSKTITHGYPREWINDLINLVTACRACNEFLNGYQIADPSPKTLEEFCDLRDRHFAAKKVWVLERHARERGFYDGWAALQRPVNQDSPTSKRFLDAVAYAASAHAGQLRKGTTIPYIAHLFGVSALVMEDGGNEDEAIAALLHDAAEDQGGEAVLKDIEARFGAHVASIVRECSDTTTTPKPPWPERKRAYLEHLPQASASAVRVSLADKLYNARAILLDYRRLGEELWSRFDPASDQLWYYQSLSATFSSLTDSPLAAELERVVLELERVMINGSQRNLLSPP